MSGQKNKGLKNRAYEMIKKRVITCEYPPDTLLNEAQLAESLGFSRTPTREAIIQLESEGFLRVIPKKGILVTPITPSEIYQIFEVRSRIEPIVLKMAESNLEEEVLEDFRTKILTPGTDMASGYRLDTAIHLYFVERCGNSYLTEMMQKVFDRNSRVIIASRQNGLHLDQSRLEHLNIIELLLDGKTEEAAQKLEEHIGHCRDDAFLNYYHTHNSVPVSGSIYKKYLDLHEKDEIL